MGATGCDCREEEQEAEDEPVIAKKAIHQNVKRCRRMLLFKCIRTGAKCVETDCCLPSNDIGFVQVSSVFI